MMEYLVFRLYGPLAAWGDIAVGEHRPAFAAPSKSAIMGLIAGSLGIDRDAEDRHLALNADYGLATFTDRSGVLIRDYHTVQVRPSGSGRKRKRFATRREELAGPRNDLGTILSHRDYRCDASAWIVLWAVNANPTSTLAEIAAALARPCFTPYLGRKSCPLALPVTPRMISSPSAVEAFRAVSGSMPDMLVGLGSDPVISVTSEDEPPAGSFCVNGRRDRLVSRRRWQFAKRREFIGGLPSGSPEEGHDAPEQD